MKIPIISIQNGKVYLRDVKSRETEYDCLNLAINQKFKVSGIAQKINISDRYLHKIFINTLGISPKDWLRNERMRLVIHLIRENNSLTDISELLGFAHYSHFCKEVKNYYDLTPMQLVRKKGGSKGL